MLLVGKGELRKVVRKVQRNIVHASSFSGIFIDIAEFDCSPAKLSYKALQIILVTLHFL